MRVWQPALQYSCLENPMDSEAWPIMGHRVAKSQTRLKQLHTGKRRQDVLLGEAELCQILGLEDGKLPRDLLVLTHWGGAGALSEGSSGAAGTWSCPS